jgi:hypothetical protein
MQSGSLTSSDPQSEQADPGHLEGGIPLTQKVIQALPPLSREDEATAATVEGMIESAELLRAVRSREASS